MSKHHRAARVLAAALLLTLAAVPPLAGAQDFHVVTVQLLHGTDFDDAAAGNATADGRMSTITLESVAGWRYGDNFFFVDLTSGDFADGPTGRHRMYGEWSSRLSLTKLTGRRIGAGILGDVLLAGGVDRAGSGFGATLVGLGTDLRLPGFAVAQLNVYRRDDTFNAPGVQVTGVWTAPLATGPLAWTLTGFADVAKTDAGTDLMTQPQLLLDLGGLFGRPGRVHGGVEWYFHRSPASTASVAQALIKLSL